MLLNSRLREPIFQDPPIRRLRGSSEASEPECLHARLHFRAVTMAEVFKRVCIKVYYVNVSLKESENSLPRMYIFLSAFDEFASMMCEHFSLKFHRILIKF